MAINIDSASLGVQIKISDSDSLNLSRTQYKNGFGKEQRFPSVKRSPNESIGYDLPSTRTKRSAGFSIGNRFQNPGGQNVVPDPCAYDLKGAFNTYVPGTSIAKGQTFGISRDYYQRVGIPMAEGPISFATNAMINTPGPGTYRAHNRTIGTEGRKFVFQGKTTDVTEPSYGMVKQNLPGPGAYELSGNEISKYGVYHLSTTRNSRAANWSPSTNTRFIRPNKNLVENPGPGSYQPTVDHISTFRNRGGVRMVPDNIKSQISRIELSARDTPGPGSYRPTSHYKGARMFSQPRERLNTSNGSSDLRNRTRDQLDPLMNSVKTSPIKFMDAKNDEILKNIKTLPTEPSQDQAENTAKMPVLRNGRNKGRILNKIYRPQAKFQDTGVPALNSYFLKTDALNFHNSGRVRVKKIRTSQIRSPVNGRNPANENNQLFDGD